MNSRIERALSALAKAARTLAKVRSIKVAKDIHDAAEAQSTAAKRAGLPADVQNLLAEISLRAARRAGELLAATPLSHGGRPPAEVAAKQDKTLRELGLNKNQSWRWRRLAAIPQEVFEAYLAESQRIGKAPSAAKLLRVADELHGGGREKRRPGFPVPDIGAEPAASTGAAPADFAEELGELQDHLKYVGHAIQSILEGAHPSTENRHAASVFRKIREIVASFPRYRKS